MLLGLDALDADELLTLVGDVLRLPLIGKHIELLTCCRSAIETEYGNRSGRTGFRNLLSTLIEH